MSSFGNAFIRQLGRETAHSMYRTSLNNAKRNASMMEGEAREDGKGVGIVVKTEDNKQSFVYDRLHMGNGIWILFGFAFIFGCVPIYYFILPLIMIIIGFCSLKVNKLSFDIFFHVPTYERDGRCKDGLRYAGDILKQITVHYPLETIKNIDCLINRQYGLEYMGENVQSAVDSFVNKYKKRAWLYIILGFCLLAVDIPMHIIMNN